MEKSNQLTKIIDFLEDVAGWGLIKESQTVENLFFVEDGENSGYELEVAHRNKLSEFFILSAFSGNTKTFLEKSSSAEKIIHAYKEHEGGF